MARVAIGRRQLLAGLPLLALAGVTRPAGAVEPGLAVSCDTTLAPVLRKLGAVYKLHSGVPVYVFPTGPGLILPQLVRDIQNDVVVTQIETLEQAARAGVVAASAARKIWRNALVVAALRGVSATDGTFAACDPSPASDFDGPALLASLGLQSARVVGAVDTDEVAFLLTTGAAQAGLLHMTDVRTDQRLDVVREVPTNLHPPFVYAASVTRLSRRPNPERFVAFLASSQANALLTESGLEVQA